MKKASVLLIILLVCCNLSQASHIIGAEIGYKHISGNTYEIYLNIYGDCSGAAFPNLINATSAQVEVTNGNTLLTTIACKPTGDFGKEITPVCPGQADSTNCKFGNIPGIAEFKFKETVIIPSASANWQFSFNGVFDQSNSAGRTNAITNILIGSAGSLIHLHANLNNTQAVNNSPALTSIPTPFFCLNLAQQFNPGAIDSDGDSLSFKLIDALSNGNGTVFPATYVSPYSGANPLATAPNSFSFNTSNGQLSFIPDLAQTSVVVYEISEYRNGVQVGSMMREMNFIIFANCNNQSPTGSITSASAGVISAPTEIELCNIDSVISFTINASDPDGQNIDVAVTGLPNGLTYSVNGNGTPTPDINFNWTLPTPLIYGSNFNFFITYQDDGCPISSKQQLAYTVKVVNPFQSTIVSTIESCVPAMDAQLNVSLQSSNGGAYQYALNNNTMQANPFFTGLSQGTYTISYTDSRSCSAQEQVIIDKAEEIEIIEQQIIDVSCFGLTDGAIQFNTLPANYATNYNLQPNNLSSNVPNFSKLSAGNYAVIASAPLGCADTLNVTIVEPPELLFTSITTENDKCELGRGEVTITSTAGPSAIYSISAPQQSNALGVFSGLYKGRYVVHIIDSNQCAADSVFTIEDANYPFAATIAKTNVSCLGDGNDGGADLTISGGTPPYSILWNTPQSETTQNITQQRSGIKTLVVTDAIGCQIKTYTFIDPANCCEKVFFPNAFSPNEDGLNDTWRMRTPLTIDILKYNVYNRWGQVVWRATNQQAVWDGSYNGKGTADVGTYFYLLKYKCAGDDNTYIKKGDVLLVR